MIWQIGFALVALAFFSLVFQLERIVEKRLGRAPLWLDHRVVAEEPLEAVGGVGGAGDVLAPALERLLAGPLD
ncbi:MAG: hypothetical protein AAFU55_17060, partial [Pseudomonadota bacterium]